MLRRMLAGLLVTLATVLATVTAATPAHAAGETASSYVVDGALRNDGSMTMRTTITFEGAAPASVEQRLATYADGADDAVYHYDITDITVTDGSKDLSAKVSDDGGYKVITVAPNGAQSIVVSYVVKGTTTRLDDGSVQFRWRVLQGLSLNVREVTGTVRSPGLASEYRCDSGAPAAPSTCGMYSGGTFESRDITFTDGPRGVGEVVQVGMRYPEGTVPVTESITYRWSLDRAFTPGWPQLLSTLGALALGGLLLWLLHNRAGRDIASTKATPVAEFTPSGEGTSDFVVRDDVRPGHVGTVSDEHVDPLDVVGSLLDLAVRGHLLITQLPSTSGFTDWSLTRQAKGRDALAPFEERLLDAVSDSKVSTLASSVVPAIGGVQDALYEDVVKRGWFSHRPDVVRRTWSRWAWLGVLAASVVAVLLVALTTFGLLGLALIALALGLMFVAQEMPARTAAGSSLLAGLRSLAVQLDTHPTIELTKGSHYAQVSRILPYAVVLGGWERWLKALVDADDDPGTADPTDLSWYHAPADWQLQQLPESLDAFVNAVRGRLFAR